MECIYQVSSDERVNNLEKELEKQLKDLQFEIEEGGLLRHGHQSFSSIRIPNDVQYFKNERKIALRKWMQVREAKQLSFNSDLAKEKLETCLQSEYTKESLPLLLHQFFLDQVQELTQCKNMHMLRWARFCEHTKEMEKVFPEYQKRISELLTECQDNIERATRLSKCHEATIANLPIPTTIVKRDDVIIFTRWLICHFHAIKKVNAFVKLGGTSHILSLIRFSVDTPSIHLNIYPKFASRYFHSQTIEWMPKSNFLFFETKVKFSKPVSMETEYDQYGWRKTNKSKEKETNVKTKIKSESSLPIFTPNIKEFSTVLDLLLKDYDIAMRSSQVESNLDEIDMFNFVLRKFKTVHYNQEKLRQFPTYEHDILESTKDEEERTITYKKESNWVPFIKIKPDINSSQVSAITKLKEVNYIDPLLLAQSKLANINLYDKILFHLRVHAKHMEEFAVKCQSLQGVRSINSNGRTGGRRSKDVWTNIFSCSIEQQQQTEIMEFDVKLSQDVFNNTDDNQFGIKTAVKKLGLPEDNSMELHSFSGNGGLLSLLLLRHLKIKDCRQTCLNILNYFRSVERTLTVNDVGLSHKNSASSINHINTEHGAESHAIGNHQYLHSTPIDHVTATQSHLQDVQVDNYDDFYSFKDNLVQVQDQKGWTVMYDVAIKDFKELELELLLVASHFIGSGKNAESSGTLDVNALSKLKVDRFAILLDLWKYEALYQEKKRSLLDCYLEVYNHVTHPKDRNKLAHVITTIMHARPMFNYDSEYFVDMYAMECRILDTHCSLIKSIINQHITDQREYLHKIHRNCKQSFGMPLKVVPIQNIAVNTSRPVLTDVFILEFHPTLSVVTNIPHAIEKAHRELLHMHQISDVSEQLQLKLQLIEAIEMHWREKIKPESTYSNQTRVDIFNDVLIEDPLFMLKIGENITELTLRNNVKKEKMEKQISIWCKILDLITYRHRLLETIEESHVLSGIYINIAQTLGVDECHAFLRPVSFEFAQKKLDAQEKPFTIQQLRDDESRVDRFIPNFNSLAIAELDEKDTSVFSFRNRAGVLAHLQGPRSLENIRLSLLTQIGQNEALKSLIEQLVACYNVIRKENKEHKSSLPQNQTTLKIARGMSLVAGAPKRSEASEKLYTAFISLQAEKSFLRDRMLNKFLDTKDDKQWRSFDEILKLKQSLIQSYCFSLHDRVARHSIRGQLLAYFYSLTVLFDSFPVTRDAHFVFGKAKEGKDDDIIEPDPTQLKPRPRSILSRDGSRVLNIWFVPHYTEVLNMFEDLDDCNLKLRLVLRIVAALHDMCHYLCAHARSGSSDARLGSQSVKFSGVTADWGGMEGIGNELREIQNHLNDLPTPSDPEQTATFLERRRDVIFLQFHITFAHSARKAFLNLANETAHKTLTACMHTALQDLSNINRSVFNESRLSVPEPLSADEDKAKSLFPWRGFLNSHTFRPFEYYDISYLMETPLCGLKDVDRTLVHGEILGVSLLLEDIVLAGIDDMSLVETTTKEKPVLHTSSVLRKSSTIGASLGGSLRRNSSVKQHSSTRMKRKEDSDSLNLATSDMKMIDNSNRSSWAKTPMEALRVAYTYLLVWSRLEMLKHEWACQRLKIIKIDNTRTYSQFCHLFNVEILRYVCKRLSLNKGHIDINCNKETIANDKDALLLNIPDSITKYEFNVRQLLQLLESLECMMITDCTRRLSAEHTFVVEERGREDHRLPIDLWKKAITKGNIALYRPHIVETFLEDLGILNEGIADNGITFNRVVFESCLAKLASNIMNREKSAYLSYSSFYENLLKQQNQQLYLAERKIKHLTERLEDQDTMTSLEIDCALAEKSYALLVEITAHRSKFSELENCVKACEEKLKEQYRQQYNDMVLELFERAFDMKMKFEVFRLSVHDDVLEFVHNVRESSIDKLKNVRAKYAREIERDVVSGRLVQAEKLREEQRKNKDLVTVISKMKILNSWQRVKNKSKFENMLTKYQKVANKAKKENAENNLIHQEKEILMKEQQEALRQVLVNLDKEGLTLRKQLKKEQQLQAQRSHAELREEQSFRHLDAAKMSSVERLQSELEEKEREIHRLRKSVSPDYRYSPCSASESKRQLKQALHQVARERSLKLEAFNRVENLQQQVQELEQIVTGTLPKHTYHESCFPIVPGGRVSPQKPRATSHPLESQRPKTSRAQTHAHKRPKSEYLIGNMPRSQSVLELLKPRRSDMSLQNYLKCEQ